MIGSFLALSLAAQVAEPSVIDLLPQLPMCGAVHGPRLSDQVIKLPVVGSEGEAELGQSMVSSVKADVHEAGLKLLEPVVVPGRAMFTNYTLTVPAGELQAGERAFRRVYIPASVSLQWASEKRPRQTEPLVSLWVSPTNQANLEGNIDLRFTDQNVVIEGAKFERSECMKLGSEGFRKELVYSGVAQGTISLEYREFINDMARPAFSQTLRYDLNEGRTIGFRGARFEILDANNISVRYRVLRELE